MNDYHIPIENEPGYVKDVRSSAILNTDLNALREYKQKKKQNAQIQSMQNEINMLKAELEIIKTHLKIS
jgi:cell shape-determining protein MreC